MHCRIEAPLIVLPQLSSLFHTVWSICRWIYLQTCRLIARWSLERTPNGLWPSNQRMWSSWFWILNFTVLSSPAAVTLESSAECSGLGFRVVLKNLWLIRSDDSPNESVWFEDAQWCPDIDVYRAPSDHHSAALAQFLCRFSTCRNPVIIIQTHFSYPADMQSFE